MRDCEPEYTDADVAEHQAMLRLIRERKVEAERLRPRCGPPPRAAARLAARTLYHHPRWPRQVEDAQ